MTLEDIRRDFLNIMTSFQGEHRNRNLADLMSYMERTFSIPALRSAEWERRNPEVFALYREISENRDF